MKKPAVSILWLVTCVFVAFAIGFFMGRSLNRAPVYIYQASGPADETIGTQTDPTGSGPVNINTASLSELQTLPGVGPVLAQRIIDYRTEHGSFRSPEELSKVEGIGQKTLLAILDLITVGG